MYVLQIEYYEQFGRKLQSIKRRFAEVQEKMSSPDVAANQQKSKELGREFRELTEIVRTADKYLHVHRNIESSREVLQIGGDAELKEMALAEIAELEPQLAILENEVKTLLVPKGPQPRPQRDRRDPRRHRRRRSGSVRIRPVQDVCAVLRAKEMAC